MNHRWCAIFVVLFLDSTSWSQEPSKSNVQPIRPKEWIRQLGSGGIPISAEFADAAISSDGKLIAIAFSKQLCVVQDRESGKELFRVKTFALPFGNEYETVLQFAPDSRSLAFGTTFGFQLLAIPDGKKIQQFTNRHAAPAPNVRSRHAGEYRPSISFDSASKVLAASNRGVGEKPPKVQLFNATTGQTTWTLAPVHNRSVAPVVSPDGTTIATWGHFSAEDPDRRVFKVEIVDGKEKLTPIRKSVDEHMKHADRVVQLWDAVSGKEIGKLQTDGERSDVGVDSTAANVCAVRFSPDGKTLIVATRQDGLFLFDVASRRKIRQFKRSVDLPEVLESSPDGTIVTEASYDREGAVRRIDDGREIKIEQRWLPNSRTLAVAMPSAKSVLIVEKFGRRLGCWDALNPRVNQVPVGHFTGVVGIAFDPSSKRLLSLSADGRYISWDENGEPEQEGWIDSRDKHYLEIGTRVGLSPNGKYVFKRLGDGGWQIRDLRTEKPLFDIPRSDKTEFVDFSNDGTLIVFASAESARILDIPTGNQRQQFKLESGDDEFAFPSQISPDRKRLAVITRSRGFRNIRDTVHLIDCESGNTLKRISISRPASIAFSPNNREIAILDESPRILDTTTMESRSIATVRPVLPTAIAYSHDGKSIVLAHWTGTSPEERSELIVFDAATGKSRRRFPGHIGPIQSLAISPDDSTIASGGEDNLIQLWRLKE